MITKPTNYLNSPPTIQGSRLEFSSLRTQLFIAFFFALIICLLLYKDWLSIGFLHDDFLHVNYIYQGLYGNPKFFIENTFGTWAGSEIMSSFRPLVSLSLLFDYVIFHGSAWGMHLSNILIFYACSFLVALISLELSRIYGNKLESITAIVSQLLFLAYPLHIESVGWIIGRVDSLCSLFYLASVYTYFRFIKERQLGQLITALICFFLSLTSKEMAYSLPLVIILIELFFGGNAQNKPFKTSGRILSVASFWLTFAAYLSIRYLAIGQFVGGYGLGGQSITDKLKNFLDLYTMVKILIPINEEIAYLSLFKSTAAIIYSGILINFCLRLIQGKTKIMPYLFLGFWLTLATLPTFQVWHIYPNLIGGRLFFLSSAPFCILLAFMLIPDLESLKRKQLKTYLCTGLILTFALIFFWTGLFCQDKEPWLKAGKIIDTIKVQITEELHTSTGEKVAILNLPADYKGVPLLTYSKYLNFLLSAPNTSKPILNTNNLVCIEPLIPNNPQFVFPGKFKLLKANPKTKFLRWDGNKLTFKRLEFSPRPTTNQTEPVVLSLSNISNQDIITMPEANFVDTPNNWYQQNINEPTIIRLPGGIRIYPSQSNDFKLLIKTAGIDPSQYGIVQLKLSITDKGGCHQCLEHRVRFCWRTNNQDYQLPIIERRAGQYLLWANRDTNYLFADRINELGLDLSAGQYYIDLEEITLSPQEKFMPELKYSDKRHEKIYFNTTNLSGARWCKLIVTKANHSFDSSSDTELSRLYSTNSGMAMLVEKEFPAGSKVIDLKDLEVKDKSIHQIRVYALNLFAVPIGLPSEPINIPQTEESKH